MSSAIYSICISESDQKFRKEMDLNIKPVIPLREIFSICLILQGDSTPKELIL